MKFAAFLAAAAIALASVSAAEAPRAHLVKARMAEEAGLEKRGSGKLTWYGGGMLSNPACGGSAPGDDELVVAVAQNGGYGSCNQRVELHYQGKSVKATIRDYCDGCAYGHFDATKGLFSHFANLDEGVLTGMKFKLL
ncbi:hypothetical protein MVES1_001752 [Malassezia vespertilionis]|uniref:RlpA-like protein double-psi beta-barrel domain-containing protein n=1 Tax=Malassezia vespertilionis TaxID=2020962 RepID=A0A2N1JD87_9BASI|nr:uncharacterized protein MVES1_001752 [Malassezia vespertilionis]PKI84497.1 hypothetical protein MVES_001650 [Malassezia vespertilionis]WFD06407.1 hypothetical protein MVES1_001752 [Malassezia vespertilionis]